MSFRLVPNSVTVDDTERRNSPNGRVICSRIQILRIFKSHLPVKLLHSMLACFPLVPRSVTLNDLERRNGRYIAFLRKYTFAISSPNAFLLFYLGAQ